MNYWVLKRLTFTEHPVTKRAPPLQCLSTRQSAIKLVLRNCTGTVALEREVQHILYFLAKNPLRVESPGASLHCKSEIQCEIAESYLYSKTPWQNVQKRSTLKRARCLSYILIYCMHYLRGGKVDGYATTQLLTTATALHRPASLHREAPRSIYLD